MHDSTMLCVPVECTSSHPWNEIFSLVLAELMKLYKGSPVVWIEDNKFSRLTKSADPPSSILQCSTLPLEIPSKSLLLVFMIVTIRRCFRNEVFLCGCVKIVLSKTAFLED